MKKKPTLSISFFVFLIFFGFTLKLLAQPTIPPDTTTYWSANERGVKIPWTRGPDSTMIKGQLIIRFHQNALDYDKLITPYIQWYDPYSTHGKGNHIQTWPDFPHSDTDYRGFPDSLYKILKLQRFYFDSTNNIVLNPSLKSFLQSEGYYLRRLTSASPVDTLSLTRGGDTIACDHYNWMVLRFDTTVNPLLLSYYLTTLYPRDIDFAVPDRIGLIPLHHPGDNIRYYDTCEIDLKHMINAEKAWDFEVGNPNLVLALFDFGVDYRHPDLGAGLGKGEHVLYGRQFSVNINGTIDPINTNQGHGTPTAGIMGALTNRNPTSVAGVAGGWGVLPSDPAGSVDEGTGCSLAILAASQANKSDYVACVFESASHSVVTDYGTGVDVINTSWIVKQDGFQEPDLHGAINYAFESGVVQCAGMNDRGVDETYTPGSFPADYEEPWMISVSGSQPDKSLEIPHVNYGYTLDLLAPAGNPIDGCGGGLNMNWTTINSTAPPNEITAPNFTYGGFGGTSASTPHVSGSAGLILSWFSRPGHTDTPKLEPEDVAGILKAAAWRGDTDRVNKNLPRTWRPKSGWGHLDIGKTFEMLNPDPNGATDSRYVLRHFSYSDSLNYGSWYTQDSSPYVFDVACSPYIHNDSTKYVRFQNRQYILNGVAGTGHQQDVYYARVRPVTRVVKLDSIWEVDSVNSPLFAWGRSGGIKEKSGWNFSSLNFQTGWSYVMDGTGGDTLNEGIFHSQGTTFQILTAQYEVWAWDSTTSGYTKYLGYVPSDSMMGVNFSVYGRLQRAISDVKSTNGEGNPSMVVSVNPSGDLVMARISTDYEIDRTTVAIYDVLGRLQSSRYEGTVTSGDNTITYPISGLPSGTYILRLSGRGFTQSKSFHIIR